MNFSFILAMFQNPGGGRGDETAAFKECKTFGF